jgi:hypothetical protein
MKQKAQRPAILDAVPEDDLTASSQSSTHPGSPRAHDGFLSKNDEPRTWKPPGIGSFQPNLSNSKGLLEFESFVQGRSKRIGIKYDIEHIDVDSLPLDFKKANCVYPRSFLRGDENEPEHWECMGVRQSEESYLNEIGWKLVRCLFRKSQLFERRERKGCC